MRRAVTAVVVAAMTLAGWAAPGHGKGKGQGKAAKNYQACKAAIDEALKLEQEAKLQEASKRLATCAQVSCDVFIQHECTVRRSQLETEIPSVVPVATDESGAPVVEVRVKMDGEVLAERIDGRGVPIDPGVHEFTFETEERGVVATKKLVILQGERNRPIAVTIRKAAAVSLTPAPEAATAPPVAKRESPALDTRPRPSSGGWSTISYLAPYVLAGVGVVGVGGYALLTTWGQKDNRQLAQCAPACSPASVDHIRKLYTAANISLAVGVVTLGTAAGLIIRPEFREERRRRRGGLTVDVQAAATGASATISGAF